MGLSREAQIAAATRCVVAIVTSNSAFMRWTAAALAISTLLFAGSVLLEHSKSIYHDGPQTTVAKASPEIQGEGANSTEQNEGKAAATEAVQPDAGGGRDAATVTVQPDADGGHDATTESGEHGDQVLFGINLENPWIVWGYVAASLLVALAVLRLATPALVAAIGLAGIAAVLDGKEVLLQMANANTGVATLAALTALVHVAVVVLAVLAWRTTPQPTPDTRKS